ncbi:MAG: HEAT repeat domain-containing protein [Candidatus Anstonellales archaeon]
MKYISDPDDYIKAAVIDAIVDLDIKEASPHIIKLLNSNNEYLVARLIRALGMLGVSDAAPKLLKFLRHNSELIRREAAIALARLSSKEAIPILVGYLKDNNKHFFERVDMALSLSMLGYKEVVPELFNLLNNQEIPLSDYGSEGYPSEQILESFVAMCRQDVNLPGQLLEMIRSSKNGNIPTQLIIDVFVEIKYKNIVPILIDLLNQETLSNIDKTAIIEALGELKATDAVPVLHKLLKEETDSYTKRKIVISLGLMGDKEVIPFLIDLLREDTYETATIANILMSLGEYEAVYKALEQEYYKVPYFNIIRRYKVFNQEKIELLKNSNINMNRIYGFLLSSMLNGSKSDYDRQISDAIEGLKGLNPKNDTAVAILLLQNKAYGEIKKGLYIQAIDTIKKAQEYEMFLSNWERKEFVFLFEENNLFLLGEAQKEMKEYDSSIQAYKNCLNILKTKEKIYNNKRAIKLIPYDEHRDMLIKVKKSLGYLMIENGKLFLKDAEDMENSNEIH